MQSSGKTDGGTGSRVFGTLLSWLNDHQSETYIVATCNDISAIPPEFLRQERWDGIFFVDQPTYEEREKIWQLYKTKYELADQDHPTGASSGWTGAEIKSACRLAYIQDIPLAEASRQVIPLSVSAAARILEIRHHRGHIQPARRPAGPAGPGPRAQDHHETQQQQGELNP
jgi:SpoVK/Ycf46/Vps4 family AAA+-type ATPase